ncbi:hypothetical protein SAMN04487914_11148 [Arthrobacter sp. ok909]|nr:hypothetical protein SAMN04487914_11148 [Arthrobacter sp. ok909]
MITTLGRTGAPAINRLGLSDELRRRGVNLLLLLNLGGGNIDTGTPMGSMESAVMPALAQMDLEMGCAAWDRRRGVLSRFAVPLRI